MVLLRKESFAISTDFWAGRGMAMSYAELTFFVSWLLILLAGITVGQSFLPEEECIAGRGSYTQGSSYQADLNELLTFFSNTLVPYGFYNSSVGEVSAIGLCRGDLPSDTCRNCISNSSQDIKRLCPNYKEAILYQDLCILRYSDRSILGSQETRPSYAVANTQNFSDTHLSRQQRDILMSDLQEKAASGGSLQKCATGRSSTSVENTYILVQCAPDLEYQECLDCLEGLASDVSNFFAYRRGGTAMAPSCNFRFETYQFYGPLLDARPRSPTNSSLPLPNGASAGDGKSNRTQTIAIVISTVVSVILISCICSFIWLQRRKPKDKDTKAEICELESSQFSLCSIRSATDDFSDSNKLGQGGFGAVYKGTLPNGQDIAVKRLSKVAGLGEVEFKNEVLLIAKLQHRNLARLLGFCLEGTERLLIYDFVPNGSLDRFLFVPIKPSQLYWERRYKIIEGIARGLLYLHEDSELRIFHGSLIPSNILLDSEMNPKVSDFGIMRLFSSDQTQIGMNSIVRTYENMASEDAMCNNFFYKYDVYNLGVLILEIVSGKRNIGFKNGEDMEGLISFAWRCWREGSISNLIDPSMKNDARSEITRCIHIGLLCVQENVGERPSMASIVLMLSSYSLTLPLPSQPALFMDGITNLKTPLL